MIRLDKLLSKQLNITRSVAKQYIKSGRVTVNGTVVKIADTKCGDSDLVQFDGNTVGNNEFVYIMLNKPKGVISATDGKGDKTVIDLLPSNIKRKNLFPAGRLDKDTTGFVLITDDGAFAHKILSPKNHIDKTYIATLDKPFTQAVADDFKNGMQLGDNKLLSASIEPLNNNYTVAKVVLKQGLYHQVKRMFKKHGITVLELDRIAMGGLKLDQNLKLGECRLITDAEKCKILSSQNN